MDGSDDFLGAVDFDLDTCASNPDKWLDTTKAVGGHPKAKVLFMLFLFQSKRDGEKRALLFFDAWPFMCARAP